MKEEKEIFDNCLKKAMKIARPYMKYAPTDDPTQQEWDLALILFQDELKKKRKGYIKIEE